MIDLLLDAIAYAVYYLTLWPSEMFAILAGWSEPPAETWTLPEREPVSAEEIRRSGYIGKMIAWDVYQRRQTGVEFVCVLDENPQI